MASEDEELQLSPTMVSLTNNGDESRSESQQLLGLITNTNFGSDSEDEFQPPAHPPNNARQVYLVTYSRADAVKVHDRAHFGAIVEEEFNRDDEVVAHWACGAEIHQKTRGFHYHLAINLKKRRHWMTVRDNLQKIMTSKWISDTGT